MPLTVTGKNALLGALPSPIYVSLHQCRGSSFAESANPGETGTGELTGGTPAYGRVSAALANATNGTRSASEQPVINVPANAHITHVGYWTAATGGSFLGWDDVPQEDFGGQGTFTVTSTTFNAA